MQRTIPSDFGQEHSAHHAAGEKLLLSFEGVTKFYGPVIGVNNVTCRVGPGITGLLGANGAGKSTLIKLASGQLRPTQGSVRIGKHAAWSTAAKRHLGYSPDVNSFYEEMTGREFVYAMARLSGFPRAEARERCDYVLAEVGMADRANRKLAGCSHGMRQRIKLAQALVHDPWLLLLDEPLLGIDPGGRREINELLVRLAEQGKTILVSSHILVDIEQLAASILMMSAGRIIASGTLAEVRALMQYRPLTVQIVAEPVRRLAALLAERSDVQGIELRDDSVVVRTRNPGEFFRYVNDMVCEQGINLSRMQTLDAGADAVFDYLQQGAHMNLLRAWATVAWLTFRRLVWSSSTLMVLLPLMGCLLFILRRHYGRAFSPNEFRHLSEFMILVFASFVVPICALAYGTSSVGADREDGTLVFLLVRPIPRAWILLAKFSATLPVVLFLVVGSYWLYCRLSGEAGRLAFDLYLPAIVNMTIAYVCLFHLFAVSFRHSTIIAMVYALFVEVLVGNLPGIASRAAIVFYGRSIMYSAGATEGLPPPDRRWLDPATAESANGTLLAIGAVALILAAIVFSRREYRDLT